MSKSTENKNSEESIVLSLALCDKFVQEESLDGNKLSKYEKILVKQLLMKCENLPYEIICNGELDHGDECSMYDSHALGVCLSMNNPVHETVLYILSFQNINDDDKLYEFIDKIPREVLCTFDTTDKNKKECNYVLMLLIPSVRNYIKNKISGT
jgi:hypothetical protein